MKGVLIFANNFRDGTRKTCFDLMKNDDKGLIDTINKMVWESSSDISSKHAFGLVVRINNC